MENLAVVREGSTGKLHRGCWLSEVTAAEVNGSEIVPLYRKLFSVEAKDFTSENDGQEKIHELSYGAEPIHFRQTELQPGRCSLVTLFTAVAYLAATSLHRHLQSASRATRQFAAGADPWLGGLRKLLRT